MGPLSSVVHLALRILGKRVSKKVIDAELSTSIYSREYLESLVNRQEITMTLSERSGKRSIEARGRHYYGAIRHEYPKHWVSWCAIHSNPASEVPCDFTRDPNGFIDFIMHLGPKPELEVRMSIRRIEPKLGFVRGNLRWHSYVD